MSDSYLKVIYDWRARHTKLEIKYEDLEIKYEKAIEALIKIQNHVFLDGGKTNADYRAALNNFIREILNETD